MLNPSGIRFGSSEIYSVLEKFTNVIDDSLCVGQRRVGERNDDNERVLLFLRMKAKPGNESVGAKAAKFEFTSELEAEIRSAIKDALSVRHVPAYIFEIDDIPVCLS